MMRCYADSSAWSNAILTLTSSLWANCIDGAQGLKGLYIIAQVAALAEAWV